MNEQKTKIGMIDMTPTWAALIPLLVHGASLGNQVALAELMRLANFADSVIAEHKRTNQKHAQTKTKRSANH